MNSSQGLRGFMTFLILLAILGTGVVGFKYVSIPTNTTSQADQPKLDPINVSVINLTDSSADVTWTSLDPSSSKLIYSTNLNSACLSKADLVTDDCVYTDQSDAQTSHAVTLSHLAANTTYFFRILTNGKIYPTDSNHTFRTSIKVAETPEPASQKNLPDDEFNGFGDTNISEPNKVEIDKKKVLGATDDKSKEPVDPLGDIDSMMQQEFKEAMTYNDARYDFNKDGNVTMADYPLFIQFATNYEQ